jgi:starch-binding outer membrane protein, SusD/RagB family
MEIRFILLKVMTLWFEYTPTIENYRARKKWEGARCCKYEYQKDLEYYVTDMENDFVLFRFADVDLHKV